MSSPCCDTPSLLWNHADKHGSAVIILAHGAGAAMDSLFMNDMATLLNQYNITVVRFEFPYMAERRHGGKKRPPNTARVLLQSWRQVIAMVRAEIGDRPLFIGGKSMGGRMATMVAAEGVEGVSGVVCLGYPFYAAGKQDRPRIEHLQSISTPVLILQGERDTMGNRETVESYALSAAVRIDWLADGNHDLKPRKASGLTQARHLASAAEQIAGFAASQPVPQHIAPVGV